MTIDEGNPNYSYGLFNGKPAYRNYYNKTIYIFKDISAKRIKTKNDFTGTRGYKIVFVTNKQLMSIEGFNEIKDCVFDGKLGTRYSTKGCRGSYHWCFEIDGNKPIPNK